MRRVTPNPCMGSRLKLLRMSMSSVPWRTSVSGGIGRVSSLGHQDDAIRYLGCQEEEGLSGGVLLLDLSGRAGLSGGAQQQQFFVVVDIALSSQLRVVRPNPVKRPHLSLL